MLGERHVVVEVAADLVARDRGAGELHRVARRLAVRDQMGLDPARHPQLPRHPFALDLAPVEERILDRDRRLLAERLEEIDVLLRDRLALSSRRAQEEDTEQVLAPPERHRQRQSTLGDPRPIGRDQGVERGNARCISGAVEAKRMPARRCGWSWFRR